MLTIAYSGKSAKSAQAIADQDDSIVTVRSSSEPVLANWGRYKANAKLNPDISNVTNKRRMRQLFQEHGVPTPQLYTLHEAHDALADRWGKPERTVLIGRPDQHMKGRGLWKITDNDSLDKALRGTRKKKAATHFMEYISKEQAPYEYRVHVMSGKSIRISEKKFIVDDTGRQKYTTIKPTNNVKHVRQAAKKALEAVGLDFGAVDILANNEECWVLEVNAAPGLGGSMPKLYRDTFLKWKQDNA